MASVSVVHASITFIILLYTDWLRINVITHAQCMIVFFVFLVAYHVWLVSESFA